MQGQSSARRSQPVPSPQYIVRSAGPSVRVRDCRALAIALTHSSCVPRSSRLISSLPRTCFHGHARTRTCPAPHISLGIWPGLSRAVVYFAQRRTHDARCCRLSAVPHLRRAHAFCSNREPKGTRTRTVRHGPSLSVHPVTSQQHRACCGLFAHHRKSITLLGLSVRVRVRGCRASAIVLIYPSYVPRWSRFVPSLSPWRSSATVAVSWPVRVLIAAFPNACTPRPREPHTRRDGQSTSPHLRHTQDGHHPRSSAQRTI